MTVAGFVLAGGKSRRFGQDKALAVWQGCTLLERAAQTVRAAAGSLCVLGDPVKYGRLGFECIADVRPDCGPLSGIESALSSKRGERSLIVACDMPQVTVGHLRELLACGSPCVTQDNSGQVHPLCAVYDESCLTAVTAALDASRFRVMDLIAELKPRIVRYPGTLANINAMEDLASVG